MEVKELIKTLCEIKTVSGNWEEIDKCIKFLKEYCESFGATVQVFEKSDELKSPAIIISNSSDLDYDFIASAHIDVVPASDKMFSIREENNKFFGRGVFDVKGPVACSIKVLEKIIKEKVNTKFALCLSSDEEVSGNGTEFLISKLKNKPKVVFDIDSLGAFSDINLANKNVVMVNLIASGIEAHGALPWDGKDACSSLITTYNNIRKHFPEYSVDNKPKNVEQYGDEYWVSTLHIGTMSGGTAFNKLPGSAEMSLDFRLTEEISQEDLEDILQKCLTSGVSYEIPATSGLVNINLENKYIQKYIDIWEKKIGQKMTVSKQGGATDSRNFFHLGVESIIMNSVAGYGLHTENEELNLESLEPFIDIQYEFIKSFSD